MAHNEQHLCLPQLADSSEQRQKGLLEFFFNTRFSYVFHNWIQKLNISFFNVFVKFVWKSLAFIQKK